MSSGPSPVVLAALASLEQSLNQVSLSVASPGLLASRNLSNVLTSLVSVELLHDVSSLSGLDALLLEIARGGVLELVPGLKLLGQLDGVSADLVEKVFGRFEGGPSVDGVGCAEASHSGGVLSLGNHSEHFCRVGCVDLVSMFEKCVQF